MGNTCKKKSPKKIESTQGLWGSKKLVLCETDSTGWWEGGRKERQARQKKGLRDARREHEKGYGVGDGKRSLDRAGK